MKTPYKTVMEALMCHYPQETM